jgi:hypothetical protein
MAGSTGRNRWAMAFIFAMIVAPDKIGAGTWRFDLDQCSASQLLLGRLRGGMHDGFSDLKGAAIDSTTQQGVNKLNKALRYAVMGGDVLAIRNALEAGASVNSRDLSGFCPLHLAVEKGQADAVTILLEKVTYYGTKGFLYLFDRAVFLILNSADNPRCSNLSNCCKLSVRSWFLVSPGS